MGWSPSFFTVIAFKVAKSSRILAYLLIILPCNPFPFASIVGSPFRLFNLHI
jgi:hypothetical protein